MFSSTQQITQRLDRFRETDEKETDFNAEEEDYLIVETEKTDKEDVYDYSFVPDLQFNTRAYTPFEVFYIIREAYQAKFKHLESIHYPNSTQCMAEVFEHDACQMILFNTVTDVFSKVRDDPKIHLDYVLGLYKDKADKYPNAKLVIPVAEVYRRHFRLLIVHVQDKKIEYCDSKSFLGSHLGRLGATFASSLMEAAQKSFEDLETQFADNHGENWQDYVSGIFAVVKEVPKILGRMAYEVTTRFSDYYRPVTLICQNRFPKFSFEEVTAADQAMRNHEDCGPLATDYATEKLPANIMPGSVLTDVMEARARPHHENSLDFLADDTPARIGAIVYACTR